MVRDISFGCSNRNRRAAFTVRPLVPTQKIDGVLLAFQAEMHVLVIFGLTVNSPDHQP